MTKSSFVYPLAEENFWLIENKGSRELDSELEGIFFRIDNGPFFCAPEWEFDESCTLEIQSSPEKFFYLLRCLTIDNTRIRLKLERVHDNVFGVKGFSILKSKNGISNDLARYIVSRLEKRENNYELGSIKELSFTFEACKGILPRWLKHEYKVLVDRYRDDGLEESEKESVESLLFTLMTIQWEEKAYLPKNPSRAERVIEKFLFDEEKKQIKAKINKAIKLNDFLNDFQERPKYTASYPGEVNTAFVDNDGSAQLCTISSLVRPGHGEVKLLGGFDVENGSYAEAAAILAGYCEGLELGNDMILYSSKILSKAIPKDNMGLAAFCALRCCINDISAKGIGFLGGLSLSSTIYNALSDDEIKACLKAFNRAGIRTVFAPCGIAAVAGDICEELNDMLILEFETGEGCFEVLSALCISEGSDSND